jgi:uncharacterized integral membrane protein
MWAELYNRWNRLLHAGIFLLGAAVATVLVVFRYSNNSSISVHWDRWTFENVPLWALAVLPLLAGFLLGYLYQLPARMHHLGEFMRHRSRVHELEKELREVRTSLDKVLEMPHDASPAKLAAPIEHRALPEPTAPAAEDPFAAADEEHAPEPETPASIAKVAETKFVARPARNGGAVKRVKRATLKPDALPEEPPAKARRRSAKPEPEPAA